MKTDHLTDRDALALTVWAEARGESVNGRVAVACVIRNRMRLRKLSAKAVCLQPMQFSCWQTIDGQANHDVLKALVDAAAAGRPVTDPIIRECYWIADGVLAGDVRDNTKGADHYLTTRLLSSSRRPSWVAKMDWTTTVDSQAFYRSRP
ncbi:MAG TPA: hypothetical protein DCQ64_20010 [Candidatus Rokubacteria bacterium]|nr:hypothetical protein [Candidatus Rokubacteria bacterium]